MDDMSLSKGAKSCRKCIQSNSCIHHGCFKHAVKFNRDDYSRSVFCTFCRSTSVKGSQPYPEGIQTELIALLNPFETFFLKNFLSGCYGDTSLVLSFAILTRQYFAGIYFCDFNGHIWKKSIKFIFWLFTFLNRCLFSEEKNYILVKRL